MCRLLLVLFAVLSLLLYPAATLAQDPPGDEEVSTLPHFCEAPGDIITYLYCSHLRDPDALEAYFENETLEFWEQYEPLMFSPLGAYLNHSYIVRDLWYHIRIMRENWNAWGTASGRPVPDDFVAFVTAEPVSGSDANLYGLCARRTADGKDGYFGGVTGEGRYYVGKHVDGKWVTLGSGASTAIATGQRPNVMALAAKGNELTFWVNGQNVSAFTDDSYASGVLGVFAGTLTRGKETEVRFANLNVWRR